MMSRNTLAVGLVAVVLLLGLSVTGVTTVAAQQANETVNGPPETTETAAFDVDENVRVTGHTYHADNETLEVTIHNRGNARATVYLVQVIEAGEEEWNFEQFTMRSDEKTTVVLEGVPDKDGDAAVMVATDRSMEDETVKWITTGENPTTWVTLPQGVLIGLVTLTGTASAMAWRRYNKPGEAPEDALKDDKGWF